MRLRTARNCLSALISSAGVLSRMLCTMCWIRSCAPRAWSAALIQQERRRLLYARGIAVDEKGVDVRQLKKEEPAVDAPVVAPTLLHMIVAQEKCAEQVGLVKPQAWLATQDDLGVHNACCVVDVCLALRA